jgi:hypothetical protein
MPTVLQFRRGTTAQNNSFTGSAGELSIDTDLEIIRVHDGSQPGGFPLVGANSTQTLLNKTLSNVVISGTITANGGVGSSGQYLESTSTGVRWSTVDATQIFNGTSSLSVISSGGNIRANVGGATIATIWSGGIDNGQANGVGNIGTSSSYFNTVFAKATSAQYADLAEKYTSDSDYASGTVVSFGGEAEITISTIDHDVCVAGVVSTDPAFIMNTGLSSQHVATVALTGRVPCRVKGVIKKGDRLVASDTTGVATALDNSKYQPGCIIGKALENYSSNEPGIIEVVVGRL